MDVIQGISDPGNGTSWILVGGYRQGISLVEQFHSGEMRIRSKPFPVSTASLIFLGFVQGCFSISSH